MKVVAPLAASENPHLPEPTMPPVYVIGQVALSAAMLCLDPEIASYPESATEARPLGYMHWKAASADILHLFIVEAGSDADRSESVAARLRLRYYIPVHTRQSCICGGRCGAS